MFGKNMLRQLHIDQLQKLIDALYMENFNGACRHLQYAGSTLSLSLDNNTSLELACSQQAGLRPYRIQSDEVTLRSGDQRRRLVPRHLMAHLVQAYWWPITNRAEAIQWWEECFDFINHLPHLLQLSTEQTGSTLAASEYLALAADRPFHPFAHAKGELIDLVPSTGSDLPQLHWWAFHRDHLMAGQAEPQAGRLLTDTEHDQLRYQLDHLAPGYIALPVLPSQHHALRSSTSGVEAVDLLFSSTAGQPTSSLRTLINDGDEHLHLKLSTSARTLGAIRSMPPRYLTNGDEAHRLLSLILEQHPELDRTVTLCDESHWSVVGQQQDIVSNPGLFGCQLRAIPRPEEGEPDQLITLSALGFGHAPVWQQLLGDNIDPWQAVKELTAQFIHSFLTLWCQGVMPECHGQNVLARYQGQQLQGFVLRDHDTLRICPARLQQQGLPLPDYQIDWSTPNSLVLESEQQLLGYFATLGLQVNLYPIALAVLNASDHDESEFWHWVRSCLETYAVTLGDRRLRQILVDTLLKSETWPFKQVLTPLLNQQAASTGMPSAMARIRNPLLPFRPNTDVANSRNHEATV